jgi:hypothetical protein
MPNTRPFRIQTDPDTIPLEIFDAYPVGPIKRALGATWRNFLRQESSTAGVMTRGGMDEIECYWLIQAHFRRRLIAAALALTDRMNNNTNQNLVNSAAQDA